MHLIRKLGSKTKRWFEIIAVSQLASSHYNLIPLPFWWLCIRKFNRPLKIRLPWRLFCMKISFWIGLSIRLYPFVFFFQPNQTNESNLSHGAKISVQSRKIPDLEESILKNLLNRYNIYRCIGKSPKYPCI